MKLAKTMAAAAASFALVLAAGDDVTAASSDASLAHVDHALRAFPATPGGAGLVDTATSEAKVALQHAGFAARDLGDLDNMKRHVRHVLHAVDPTLIENGPGAGYGGRKAAEEAAVHIELAASAEGASDNVKTHAQHIASSSRNAAARMENIADLAGKVDDAETAEDAARLVQEIQRLAEAAISGIDEDGDGRISWGEGEGGLDTAILHGGFLMKGEGIE